MQLDRRIKRRHFLVLLSMSLLWLGLVVRLWWIQLGSPHRFSRHGVDLVKAAVKQRQQSIVLHSGRGDIVDRNGYAFTGEEHLALILFPLARGSLQGTDGLQRLAQITGESKERLSETMEKAKVPLLMREESGKLVMLTERQAEEINALAIPGVVALAVTERYRADEVAKHLIGFIHKNPGMVQKLYPDEWTSGKMNAESTLGASGLERSFDRFLQGVEPSILSYYVDGHGQPLRGLDIRYTKQSNQYYPLSLTTTLDAAIQRSMEAAADQVGLKEGSIVVLDVQTADVLAAVSRPTYDQTNVTGNTSDWKNRAFKQLPPGSVYKTVVTAAALAEGIVSPIDRFTCTGEYGKYQFSCWKKEGHGSVTLEEAYAQSCNIAIAHIAKMVGGEKLEEYAKKLGLTTPVGHVTPHLYKLKNFKQLDGEEPGRVFAEGVSRDDEGVLIQSAIGQRDVRITPLQAANMMVTILRGGQSSQVRLVKEIAYRNGQSFHTFPEQELSLDGIDYVTANKLRKMMRKVVTEGTGQMLMNSAWQVAGKSGTAQIGDANGNNHLWFLGYAPLEEPRYAICVVAENQPSWGKNQAMELFHRAVAELADHTAQSSQPREEYFRG
ncbi:peptidoglycan D,D-transpeptidase FtsI family protein [Brevibacillus brevis]|uniref:peptidoglycan D,D-transpeptidase FtsI family protein n=1 Tax=Brevibacillus brevis TaxID=1393 RepID=UPI000D0ECA32|nr:penicillin-binding protein 2 [Brevibacillus brevis]PSJ66512.1 penicillin-binding protein [Brevibacillus brevis]RED24066.1 cell division protein FtsI/penicillin-binding protein 2 [Brevibacillus brevis]GEC92297.1 penicillin-binding protein 4B [Brevibacillus brevis]VEF90279.1 Peptidoglycan synthase FtsI precursor [Brevibacillus brevis]